MTDLTGLSPMTALPPARRADGTRTGQGPARRDILRASWRRDVPWALALAFFLAAALTWASGYVGLIDIEIPLAAAAVFLVAAQQYRYAQAAARR